MNSANLKLKVLIVDDEPLAREGVKLLLSAESDMFIAGECGNGADAIKKIQQLRPDIVFLDIKMPRVSGFDVIDSVGPENMPAVIFLTAYDEYAVEAFKVNALDYLLKPISQEHFHKSLLRARESIKHKGLAEKAEQLRALLSDDSTPSGRIMIRNAGHVIFLSPADIFWIESSGDYVTVHVDGHQHLLRETMKNMEQRLSAHEFKRIHRSAIVNLKYISELIANENGDYQVILTSGTELRLSRSYRDALYSALNA